MCYSYTDVMHAVYVQSSHSNISTHRFARICQCKEILNSSCSASADALLNACYPSAILASREAKMKQQALLACLVSSRKVDEPFCFDAHSGCLPLQGLTYQRHETLWRYCGNFLRQGMGYLSPSFLFGGASPHFPAPLCNTHTPHCNPYSAYASMQMPLHAL